MANNITLAETYLPLLDEVYKASAKTAILDATKVEFIHGNTVKVFKTSMSGLGDYDRNSGFVPGDVTGTWETMTLSQDRGRAFVVDRMDNEETIGMAFGTLAGEFVRTKVVPEVDAYTFSKMAGTTGILGDNADIVVGTTDVSAQINAAEMEMNEAEVPNEGRILFISETAYAGLKENVPRTVQNEVRGINNDMTVYNEMRIVRVPQNRFYTAISLLDGSSQGETAGGYEGTASTGYKINFMIVHPSALTKVVKHARPRIFTPDEYQQADGWKFDYRIYYDTFPYDNKLEGIYMHRGSTALV